MNGHVENVLLSTVQSKRTTTAAPLAGWRALGRCVVLSPIFGLFLLEGTASAAVDPEVPKPPTESQPARGDNRGDSNLDTDGDGLPDARDACPTRPETWNRVKDDDGCPEYDTDGDGLLDAQDACPSRPENWNGVQDDDGCPEIDVDGDGKLDIKDKCPSQPETWNGFQDDDGCPDGGTGTGETVAGGTGTGGAVAGRAVAGGAVAGRAATGEAAPAAAPVPAVSLSGSDDALLKELEAATSPPPGASSSPPGAGVGNQAGEARGVNNGYSNVFNPAMSINGLFLGTALSGPESEEASTGLKVQEVELQFITNVDPYFSANLILAMEGGEGLEVEEGFLQVTPQPANLSFRFGKMKVPFGRENYLHTHALPFIDKSLVSPAVLGEEGLGEVGLEVSWLAPLPFYSLVYASALNGDNENLFNSAQGKDLAYFGGLKSLFDLTDDSTLEAGLSYAAGKNSDDKVSQAAGAHLIYKWKPARTSTSRSAVAVLEALYSDRPEVEGSEAELQGKLAGAYGSLQWQLARRWYVAGRFDYLGLNLASSEATKRESVIFTLAPTEFSALRLQGSATQPPEGGDPVYEAFFQVNFTLGAHPAHSY